jgi:hypothetical protein
MGRRRLGLSFHVCLGNKGGVIKDVSVRKTILIIPLGILLLSAGHDSFFKLFLKSEIKWFSDSIVGEENLYILVLY